MAKTIKKKNLFADLSLFLVAAIWGSGFVVTKNAVNHITPFYMLAIRFFVSFILMAIIFWKKVRKTEIEDIKAGLIIGFFLFTAFATQTYGIKYTTASKQAFITASNVVMVPFFYWIVSKERPKSYEIVSAIICFIGIGILSFEKNFSIGLGDSLSLLCAVFFASHIVSIGVYSGDRDPILLTIYQMLMAGILSLVSAIIFEPKIVTLTKDAILAVLYLSIFSTLIAFLIQNLAQKHTTSTKAAIILSTEALFGSLFSFIFLKEPFSLKFLIGCSAILFSIINTEVKLQL